MFSLVSIPIWDTHTNWLARLRRSNAAKRCHQARKRPHCSRVIRPWIFSRHLKYALCHYWSFSWQNTVPLLDGGIDWPLDRSRSQHATFGWQVPKSQILGHHSCQGWLSLSWIAFSKSRKQDDFAMNRPRADRLGNISWYFNIEQATLLCQAPKFNQLRMKFIQDDDPILYDIICVYFMFIQLLGAKYVSICSFQHCSVSCSFPFAVPSHV